MLPYSKWLPTEDQNVRNIRSFGNQISSPRMEKSHPSSSDLSKGPFTATRLWNEVVREMKANIPVKRRRWRLKVYDDVFVASEALAWLHEYLKKNPKFGPNVGRHQAVQLCQKFLRSGVIEDARGKDYNSSVFEDNGQLYRFVNIRYSPYKPIRQKNNNINPTIWSPAVIHDPDPTKMDTRHALGLLRSTPFTAAPSRTPLLDKFNVLSSSKSQSACVGTNERKMRRRSSRSQKCFLDEVIMNPAVLAAQPHNRRSLNEQEIAEVWWSVAITRMSGMLALDTSLNSLKQADHDISCVQTNAQEQNLSKASDVLPQWLTAAMKCLIQWPNNVKNEESCLPKYPGFERDIFRAVVEYFDNLVGPLVCQELLTLFKKASESIRECKVTALRALQYCCLFLKPFSRHVLQVLIKFIVRLSNNHSLVLSDDLPTRELLIQTFSPCIFGASGDVDVIRILYFMIENFPGYFKNPEGYQFQVQQRILFLQNCRGNKVTATPSQISSVAYCERVTKRECEELSRITSQRSLRDLLDTIIENEAMTEKGRKKQLKQFEKSYPDIYHSRFSVENLPSCARSKSSEKSSEKSGKIKQVIKQPLMVLRNFR